MKTRYALLARTLLLLAVSAPVLTGCDKKPHPGTAAPRASGAGQAAAPGALSQQAKQRLSQVLVAYERLRNELAHDDIAATSSTAEALERAARDAAGSVPDRLRPSVQKLGSVAEQMKQMPKQDAAIVRRSFGQVSEALISVLSSEPSLQEGRRVFECPMAQGYKKWVQTSEQVSNPYMGTAMSECGTPSKWESG